MCSAPVGVVGRRSPVLSLRNEPPPKDGTAVYEAARLGSSPSGGATMRIFKERPGVISKESVWVCIHEEYMYVADTLEALVAILNTEWEHEKHLVG